MKTKLSQLCGGRGFLTFLRAFARTGSQGGINSEQLLLEVFGNKEMRGWKKKLFSRLLCFVGVSVA